MSATTEPGAKPITIEQYNQFKNNAKPQGLSLVGESAYEMIMSVLIKFEQTNTGGCKTFYSPAEWKARGEQYGLESELIVVYDGGDVRPFFTIDAGVPSFYDAMEKALFACGLYAEPCTGWYAAVYRA